MTQDPQQAASLTGATTMERQGSGLIRIFRHPQSMLLDRAIQAPPQVGFVYPATIQGSTTHFNVYYDPSLGANGQTIANGVLATCENEYNILSFLFGGITPGPFNIIIAPLDPSGQGQGGAFHFGCGATDLYCDAKTVPGVDIDYTRLVVVAEEVEVFSDAQGLGWDCGASNGEGLSRVLATLLYSAELDGYTTAAAWLDTPDRPDFINVNDPTDRNSVSTGCSVLFLNYLHYQLDFTWAEIVQAGAPTLAQTYTKLTQQPDGLTPFKALLQAFYPVGTLSGVTTDNVFPLLGAIGFPFCSVQFQGTVAANSTATWFTYNWPVLWDVVWTVVPTSVGSGGPQIGWTVQTQKGSGDFLVYWITITNVTSSPVDIEARYCILGD
jgi:hypothetical protein